MPELLERDHYDHRDFDGLLPRIGCGVCGRAVQTVPEDRGQVHAAFHTAEREDEAARQLRVDFQEPMAAWQRRHAEGHSQQEHREAERRLSG